MPVTPLVFPPSFSSLFSSSSSFFFNPPVLPCKSSLPSLPMLSPFHTLHCLPVSSSLRLTPPPGSHLLIVLVSWPAGVSSSIFTSLFSAGLIRGC